MFLRAIPVAALLVAGSVVSWTGFGYADAVVPCNETALKTAIGNANTHGGGSIRLAPNCTYTITTPDMSDPDTGLPTVTTPITVQGNGDTITRDRAALPFRLFRVGAQGRLALNRVTVRKGHTAGNGGGILVDGGGVLRLDGSRIVDNVAAQGGGIFNLGRITANDSRISRNQADRFSALVQSGPATATVLNNTAVTENIVHDLFPVIASDRGRLVLNRSRVARNNSLGIRTNGGTTINDSVVLDNDSGGVQLVADIGIPAMMEISHSIIAGNHSPIPGAGLLNFHGTVTLRRSIVVNNVSDAAPGGIWNNSGTVSLLDTLVAGNKPTNCAGSPTPIPGCIR